MNSDLCFTSSSVCMLFKVNPNLVMGYIFSHLKFSMSLHWEHWNENWSWCEMLELTYLPCHLKHQGAGCLTMCGFILFEVPPSKIAGGRIFSDSPCDCAIYSCHLTGREGSGCPEIPDHNLGCVNVPSFGYSSGGLKVWSESYSSSDANTEKFFVGGFLPNLFSLVLSSALCLKIMIKNILFFVFESVFTSLHEVHFWNSLGAYSLTEPCFSQRQ